MERSDDVTSQERGETAGMRAMFWTWMTLIGGGLLVMILIPLGGR